MASALAALPITSFAQPSTSEPASVAQVMVRSVDAAQPVTMRVEMRGALFAGLGPAPGADGKRVGRVQLTGAGGTATTPAALDLSAQAGIVTFQAPPQGPDIQLTLVGTGATARGRVVRVVRDSVTRRVHVEASAAPIP